jgi:hypothetical protein
MKSKPKPKPRVFRVVRVKLECGCAADLNTSRWRVSKSLAATIVADAVRKSVWCLKCGGQCQPTEFLGVFAEAS